MIASLREAFQAHLENRQRENTQTFINPLKSKWFYIAVICVFLATFSGLIYWQYGDKLASIFAPISQPSPEPERTQVEPGSAYNKLIGNGETDESETTASNSATQATNQIGNVELVSAPNDDSADVGGSLIDESSDNGPLITNWENAVSSLPEVTPSSEQADNNQFENAPIEGNTTDSNGSEVVSSGALSDQQSAQGAKSNSDGVNDNVTPTTVASESSQEGWIGENDYAIQLLAMKSESVLSEFLRENNLTEQTRIYKTTRYGGDWFVVVNKQIYTSLSQAQQARTNLPEYPGKQNAFIKRGNQILSEMSKAQN